jgi:hypothetical protein
MNGYQYLIARNRMMQRLEDNLGKLRDLPRDQREAETKRLQAEFDEQLGELYAQVADEYPGERRRKRGSQDAPG